MHARATLFELDLLRFDQEAAVARFGELVLPALREQPGYLGVYVLVNLLGRGLVLTLWEREQDAAAGLRSGFYAAQVDKFVSLFRSPPGRDGYEVVLYDVPALAAG